MNNTFFIKRYQAYLTMMSCLIVAVLLCSSPVFAQMQDSGGGYIDKRGQVVIPWKFGWASPFSGGLAYVENDERDGRIVPTEIGYIDKQGNYILYPRR
jgi:hypothetical protein